MAGSTGLLPPPVTTPPTSVGGINTAPGPTSSTNYSPFTTQGNGGTDQDSMLNQGMTPTEEVKAANDGDASAKNTTTFPIQSYTPPPGKVSPTTFLADWYRYGNTSSDEGTESILPRMVDDFDEEEASIYVYAYDAKSKLDKPLVPPYTKLIIENVTESHAERSQIVETFGDFYVFLFGERPPMYNFSGTLINTKNANWVADFKYYYDQYLRGTKCVESGARLVITYGGRQIEGFMLSMQTATDAALEKGVKVSFPIVVTRKSFIAFSKDFGFVTIGGESVPNEKLQTLLDQIAGAEGIGSGDPKKSDAAGKVDDAMQTGKASSTDIE